MPLRRPFLYILIASIVLVSQDLLAVDCVCVKYPMYPYSNGYWLHYAIKTEGACVQSYPMSQIQTYTTTVENCTSTTCGTCTNWGTPVDAGTVLASHLYTSRKPPYSELATVDASGHGIGIKDFFKNNTLLTGAELTVAQRNLDSMTFEYPLGETQPPVVKIPRRTSMGTTDYIYAVLWRMRFTAAHAEFGYIGIEISLDGHEPSLWDTDDVSRAFSMATVDGEIVPVIVRGLLEVKTRGTTYMVRLLNSNENKLNGAFPAHVKTASRIDLKNGASAKNSPSESGLQPCCPSRVEVVPCCHRRFVWRFSYRQCH